MDTLHKKVSASTQNAPAQKQNSDCEKKQSQWLRQVAERWERHDRPVTAVLLRNEAYRLEQESL